MVKAAKQPTTARKPVKKVTKKVVVKKSVTKQKLVKPVVSNKVDYYPNRMTVAISALAGTLIVLFALIAVLGSQ